MIGRRFLLGGVAAGVLVGRARAAAAAKITLAVSSNSLAYGGLHIAQKAGLFEKHGIDPTISVMDSGSAAMTAVLSGSIELCSASLGEVLAARVRGQAVVVVVNMYRGLSGSLVLGKAVAEKLALPAGAPWDAKLKAIGGMTIATPSATSSYTFPFRIAGQAVGAMPHFVYMSQPAMLAALQAGAVQGIIAGAPFSTQAVSSGAGVMWVNGPRAELPADMLPTSSACVETSEAYAKSHPDVLSRLRASFDALSRLIQQQPAQAEKMLASAYPQLSADTIAAIFRNDAPNWARPTMTLDDIRHEITLQERAGLLKGVEKIDPASVLAP
jgi:ABC-type nitrate/sulfonate/bicarbonate transport system substrate-binding protein